MILKIASILLVTPSIIFSQCNGCNAYYFGEYFGEDPCTELVNDPNDCNADDIQFLSEIISINGITEATSSGDVDNNDGIFLPLELGKQIWEEGRLIYLNLTFGEVWLWEVIFFDYFISILPESIGMADNIELLEIEGNSLQEIPNSIGDNTDLVHPRFGTNQIVFVPESICSLPVNWFDWGYFAFTNNNICSHYPSCLDDIDIGNQNCENFLPGDANNDYRTDVLDLVIIVGIILDGDIIPITLFVISDIDENNDINISDIIIIVNQILNE